MNWIKIKVLSAVLVCGGVASSFGQAKGVSRAGVTAASGSRNFQLTMVIESPQSGETATQPTTQSITTEIVVVEGRTGSGKARMTSQLPSSSSSRSKLVELGTKLDCTDVYMDGNELALHFVLETSRFTGYVESTDEKCGTVKEPLISQRTVELSVKVPLDRPKIVFDSRTVSKGGLKPLPESAGPGRITVERFQQPELRVELMATELK